MTDAPFAGCRQIQVADEAKGITFPALVLYPTDMPSTPTAFGPYSVDVAMDAAPVARRYPLIVISHGNGGWHLPYRTLGAHLARHGYVVAMLEHFGNNRRNNELEGSDENLMLRPRHARMTIDAVAADAALGHCVDAGKVALIGHSIGGYTALAVAGGTPWTAPGRPVDVVADPRVRCLVLLAPATPWYLKDDALRQVTVPILMLIGERDQITPRWHAEVVLNGVPDRSRVRLEVIENAGHFSFLSPFPPAMHSPGFAPATDPEGFDRERFHQHLPAAVQAFLDTNLGDIP